MNTPLPWDLLLNPHNPLRPAEWAPIDEEMLVTLAPKGALVMTPEQRASMNRLALGEWFLVRNVFRLHCRACRPGGYGSRSRLLGEIHDYVTIECVESPFNGLRQIMWWLHDVERQQDMVPGTMRDHIRSFLEGHKAGGDAIYRLPHEVFLPISAQDARTLMGRIKQRGGRPVIEQCPPRPREVDSDLIRHRIAERQRMVAKVREQERTYR